MSKNNVSGIKKSPSKFQYDSNNQRTIAATPRKYIKIRHTHSRKSRVEKRYESATKMLARYD